MAEPRAGIGIVVPFDFALDDEYWRYTPAGVVLHLTRTPALTGLAGTRLAEAVARPEAVRDATRALLAAGPAVVIYACTAGSFVDGLAGEARLRREMERAGAPIALTTSGALLKALAAFGARRVAVASPYGQALTGRLVDFLIDAGYVVTSAERLNLDDGIWRVPRETVTQLAVAADRPDAEAVVVSCTNLPTLDFHADLEARLGKPVLTANQVTMWAALRAAGHRPAGPPQALLRAAP